ncbi:hypothetical protein KQY30_32110 [Streptomyces sp. GMY02]|uniref:hypothetical protein n=1 Tax=Streptomyces sp. GMY02 TaxID=1333528 RepID=UPI001C2BA31D|nr:hypothetical protein [Streptomyces sp. GMY02]QXE38185.1 hypothetical protein KQY30_32110 [Streptomyces sp. GMY02]
MSSGHEGRRPGAAGGTTGAGTDAGAAAGRTELLDTWAGRIAGAVAPDEISFAGPTARVYAAGGRGRRALLHSAPPAPGGAGGELATLLPTLWDALASSYQFLMAALASPATANAISGAALLLALEERAERREAAGDSGAGTGDPAAGPVADAGPAAPVPVVGAAGVASAAPGAADASGPVPGVAPAAPAPVAGTGTAGGAAVPAAGSGSDGGADSRAPALPAADGSGPAPGAAAAPAAASAIGSVPVSDLAVIARTVVHVSSCLQDGGMERRVADRVAAEAVAALYAGRRDGAGDFLGALAGDQPPGAPGRRRGSVVRRLRRRLAARLAGRGSGE